MSHRSRLDRLDTRITAPQPREEFGPWRETVPGVEVRNRLDGTGCEIRYPDYDAARDHLDGCFRHFYGLGFDEMRAEYPSVFDDSLGLDIMRRAALATGQGYVSIEDPEDVVAVEMVIGSLEKRLGVPLDAYVEAHPEAVRDLWGKRTLFLEGIPWPGVTSQAGRR